MDYTVLFHYPTSTIMLHITAGDYARLVNCVNEKSYFSSCKGDEIVYVNTAQCQSIVTSKD